MTAKLFYHQKSCRLCKNTNLSKALELEPTPAGNNFLTEKEKIENNEPIFPLELFFCNDCFHIQLGHIVEPKHLFKNYHFVSGTSQVNVNHFDKYAEDIISKFNLKKDSFVSGNPAMNHNARLKQIIAFKKLPEIIKNLTND